MNLYSVTLDKFQDFNSETKIYSNPQVQHYYVLAFDADQARAKAVYAAEHDSEGLEVPYAHVEEVQSAQRIKIISVVRCEPLIGAN